jgi:2-oxoisovalerate dehydrogenase E1 component alpha subunit
LSTYTNFQIPYVQILNEQSQLNPETAFDLPKEKIIKYFRIMNLIQLFDKKAISLQRTGRMGTYAPIAGQEAIGTAIGMLLEKEDIFIPYYRDYAALYQRGVKLSDILQFWGGDERGSLYSHNSHDFPLCVPIASQCQHAVGVAYALQYKQSQQIALVTIGDGGTSEGDFYEAINAAGVMNLPVVFVIINNQWAISVPRNEQTKCKTLAQKAIAAGIPGIQVDGNDIFALHQTLAESIEKARGPNATPCVIEALTYRLSDHTTADDASRYQPKAEVSHAQHLEPIKRLENFITQEKILSPKDIQLILEECRNEVDKAAKDYLEIKPPTIESIFDYHFKELPPYLVEQRATAIEEFQHAHD